VFGDGPNALYCVPLTFWYVPLAFNDVLKAHKFKLSSCKSVPITRKYAPADFRTVRNARKGIPAIFKCEPGDSGTNFSVSEQAGRKLHAP